MDRRELDFHSFDEVVVEIEHLHAGGYRRVGNWDLAQVCRHLSVSLESALSGASFKWPWLVRKLIGPRALRRVLRTRKIPPGVKAPIALHPAPGGDVAEAVQRVTDLLRRVRTHTGEFHPHPFFGALSPEQTRDMHLIHCAHHLGFLIPGESE